MTHWFAALVTWWGTLLGPGDTAQECLLLGRLDAERAWAFVTADEARLDAVYSSDALRDRDAAVLRDYSARALHLEGMVQLRSSCRLVERAPDRIVLDVVDRLGPTRVRTDAGTRTLPEDRPTRRTVTLVLDGGTWTVQHAR